MDPIVSVAWARAIEAVAIMITRMIEGQPDEVKKRAWERWDKDMESLRKFFKIDDEPKKASEEDKPNS